MSIHTHIFYVYIYVYLEVSYIIIIYCLFCIRILINKIKCHEENDLKCEMQKNA